MKKTIELYKSFTGWLAVLALIMSPVTAPSAWAQQRVELEEIVVTAQKREETLQDAPVALTALSSEQLTNLGIKNLADLSQGAVPTLRISPYPNSPSTLIIAMRGVGVADAGSVTTEIPVGIYIDGVYVGRSQGLGADIIDLERLEVLRGPQGTLYGRNSSGGAVSFVSKKPTGEFGFKQSLSAGTDWDYLRSVTQLNLPSYDVGGGDLSLKFSYLYSQRDGWVENPNTGEFGSNFWGDDREGGRFAAYWERSNFSANYSYDFGETEVGQAWFQLYQSPDGRPTEVFPDAFPGQFRVGTVGFPIANVAGFISATEAGNQLAFITSVAPWRTAANESGARSELIPHPVNNRPTTVDTEAHTLNLVWDINENLQIKSITGYREVEQFTTTAYSGAFGIGLTNLPFQGRIEQEQFTQEFQLIGDALDSKLRYVAGVYYFDEDITERQGQNRTAYVTMNDILAAARAGAGDLAATAAAVTALTPDPARGAQLLALLGQVEALGALLQDPATARTAGAILAFPILDANNTPFLATEPGLLVGSADPSQDFQTRLTAGAESIAIYGQFEYDINEDLTLTVGLRYTDDERTANRTLDTRALARAISGDPVGAVARNQTSDNFDYAVTLDYDLQQDINVYFRVATGYKAAGVDRRSLDFGTFDKETLDTYELGLKSLFFDRTLQVNLAAFDSVYEDRQTTFTDPHPLAMVTDTLTRNATTDVDLAGIEAELLWLPLPGLQFGLSYAYLDWEFPLQTIDINGDGETLASDNEVDQQFDIAQAPQHAGTFTLDYTFPQLPIGQLAFHFNWVSSSDFVYSPRLNRSRDARDIMNARLRLSEIPIGGKDRGQLEVTLWGTNISDEEYALYAIDEINSGNETRAYGQPRTFGIDIVYEF